MRTYNRSSGRGDFSRELDGERLPVLAAPPKKRNTPFSLKELMPPAPKSDATALAKRAKPKSPGNAGNIDPARYVKKYARSVMLEFNEVCCANRKLANQKTNADLEERARKWNAEISSPLARHMLYENPYDPPEINEMIRGDKKMLCKEAYELGEYYLSMRNWYRAYECFRELTNAYLLDKTGAVDREMGEDAIRKCRQLARAWVFGKASDLAELETAPFEFFFEGSSWDIPYSTVSEALARAGRLQDLPAIAIIGAECGECSMECHCSDASNFIRVREGLRFVLAGMDKTKRDSVGIGNLKLSDEQLAYTLSFLMKHVGFSSLLAVHPAFAKFGGGVFGVISPLMENLSIHKILKEKIDVEFCADVCFQNDAPGLIGSMHFLLQEGFISKRGDPEELITKYALTEKGKILVTELSEGIKGIRISYNE